jgi:hypothetical protein
LYELYRTEVKQFIYIRPRHLVLACAAEDAVNSPTEQNEFCSN